MGFYRKYNLNENFFEKIDSEEKAYTLGFIYADGYNRASKKGVTFIVKSTDIEILEKIKMMTESNANIIEYENNGYSNNKVARLDLNSYKLSKDLNKLGADSNKTYKISFPLFIDEKLIHHFIRGYFDGDGCIWNGKRKKMFVKDKEKGIRERIIHNVKFTVTSNTNFILGLQNHLCEAIGLKRTKIYHRKKENKAIATLEYSGRGNIKKLYDYMYKDATVYLTRKYEKFNEILFNEDKDKY